MRNTYRCLKSNDVKGPLLGPPLTSHSVTPQSRQGGNTEPTFVLPGSLVKTPSGVRHNMEALPHHAGLVSLLRYDAKLPNREDQPWCWRLITITKHWLVEQFVFIIIATFDFYRRVGAAAIKSRGSGSIPGKDHKDWQMGLGGFP
ncbi:hypothetical protein J6590_001689 [Homalodisca vitripennis]|nr:hypothetical protein J6590_001689 [Homalodisca vitripennis]